MVHPGRLRPTVVRIDLGAIRGNARLLRARIEPDQVLMAIVAGDACGHGAVPVARTLVEEGVHWLGVAHVEEGLRLREAGIDRPILVLGGFPDGSEAAALGADLHPIAWRSASLRALNAQGARRALPVPVHLAFDLGNLRRGLPPGRLPELLDLLTHLEHLRVDGVRIELPECPAPTELDLREAGAQLQALLAELRSRGAEPRWIHTGGSHSILRGLPPLPEATVVSAGLAFLGVAPEARIDGAWPLLPALSWESAITELRPMETGVVVGPTRRDLLDRTSILAAVPVGTADGLPSVLGGRAEACVRGRRAPVLGGVGADSILLDVTEVPQVREGDRVVLLGRQGKEEVPALELSALSGRTVRELLEGISPRVPRQYRDLHGPIDLPLPEE